MNNGKLPQILDIVDVPLEVPARVEGQPEDWLIARDAKWIYRGRFGQQVVDKLIEDPPNLWLESLYRSDRVSPDFVRAKRLPSLYLIRASRLYLEIKETINGNGETVKKRRARFIYNGIYYDLALTDPVMQERFFPDFPQVAAGRLANGPADDSVLCVSLAPVFNGFHYKLVAMIMG